MQNLDNDGCEFGRIIKRDMEHAQRDIDNVGKKVDNMNTLLNRAYIFFICSLITLLLNLLVTIVTKK